MKKFLLIIALCSSSYSCSLLQRYGSEEEPELREGESGEAVDNPLFDASGQEIAAGSSGRDTEVARLKTKIAGLETKVEVLTASLERAQAMKSQPIIQAEAQPETNMAAPVNMAEEIQEQSPQISAAPARPAPAPILIKSMDAPVVGASAAEREFRASMQLFQNGQNLEAASRFALMAKKFPNHLLAGHALYWAGEANARGKQMGMAADNWLELENLYPRSAYLPEALAGLAKAYERQGDTAKAQQYRSLVLNSFSKSPVALRLSPERHLAPQAANSVRAASHAPAEPSAVEEQAPTFESSSEEDGQSSVENQ